MNNNLLELNIKLKNESQIKINQRVIKNGNDETVVKNYPKN